MLVRVVEGSTRHTERMTEGKNDDTAEDIDPHLVWMFEQELLHQWDHTVRAVSMMNAVLDGHTQDQELFWFGLDAALGALGNISKVFWPTRGAKADTVARCAHLRQEYGLGDGSMLQSRNARDAMEHFDERIDRWYRTSVRRNFADRIIASPEMIVGIDPEDYARHYDPAAHVITVSGAALEFQRVVGEVDALISLVRERHEVAWFQREGAAQPRP